MNELQRIFSEKLTENLDKSYNTTGNSKLLDIFFMSQYYRNHLNEVFIGNSDKEKLFAKFIRDPRLGLGERDLGRILMVQSEVAPEEVYKAGRADDLIHMTGYINKLNSSNEQYFNFFIDLLEKEDLNAKKWAPRFTNDRAKQISALIMKKLNLSKKEYRKLVKCDTVETLISDDRLDEIEFSKLPSLAFMRYISFFNKKMQEDFSTFMQNLEKGTVKINTGVLNPYDLALQYREGNVTAEQANTIFEQLPKVNLGSILTIVDNSGSMYDSANSYLKARAIAHYVAKNSTYMPNQVISFESNPKLLKLSHKYAYDMEILDHDSDMGGTNFGKVMRLIAKIETDFPDYLLVLSDMEFDIGSTMSKDEAMKAIRRKGASTKIVWWNFNTRNTTSPELDEYGNIFISGYNPKMLKFLESGFDGEEFLNTLLEDYRLNFYKE